jgi:hypothetical protein
MRQSICGAVAMALAVLALSCCPTLPPRACPEIPEPHPALEDPLVTQARADACAAMQWVTRLELCRLAPSLPQNGREFAAVVIRDGGARVTYSRADMSRIGKVYSYPALVGVFAHELSHVVDAATGASTAGDASIEEQLRADMAGGCALAVLGLRVEPFQRLLRTELSGDAAMGEVRAMAALIGHGRCLELGP